MEPRHLTKDFAAVGNEPRVLCTPGKYFSNRTISLKKNSNFVYFLLFETRSYVANTGLELLISDFGRES